MRFVVTFRFHGNIEVHKRMASSMKIDGKGSLILYDKNLGVIENLILAELSDLSIESVRSRAARSDS
jgi:hypothetical protein